MVAKPAAAAAAGPGLTPYALAPSIRLMPVKRLTNASLLQLILSGDSPNRPSGGNEDLSDYLSVRGECGGCF